MNERTTHTTDSSGNNTGNSWMDHPAINGMDPVKLELIRLAAKADRRQKRKITGSCDDGTHHQRKQKRGSSSLRRKCLSSSTS